MASYPARRWTDNDQNNLPARHPPCRPRIFNHNSIELATPRFLPSTLRITNLDPPPPATAPREDTSRTLRNPFASIRRFLTSVLGDRHPVAPASTDNETEDAMYPSHNTPIATHAPLFVPTYTPKTYPLQSDTLTRRDPLRVTNPDPPTPKTETPEPSVRRRLRVTNPDPPTPELATAPLADPLRCQIPYTAPSAQLLPPIVLGNPSHPQRSPPKSRFKHPELVPAPLNVPIRDRVPKPTPSATHAAPPVILITSPENQTTIHFSPPGRCVLSSVDNLPH